MPLTSKLLMLCSSFPVGQAMNFGKTAPVTKFQTPLYTALNSAAALCHARYITSTQLIYPMGKLRIMGFFHCRIYKV